MSTGLKDWSVLGTTRLDWFSQHTLNPNDNLMVLTSKNPLQVD